MYVAGLRRDRFVTNIKPYLRMKLQAVVVQQPATDDNACMGVEAQCSKVRFDDVKYTPNTPQRCYPLLA